MTDGTEFSVRIDRDLAASPERVWRALTTPELASWFWPPRLDPSVTIDLRVGGAFRVASPLPDMVIDGTIVELTAPKRLVYDSVWGSEPRATRVTITLEPLEDGGTRLSVLHERFLSASDCGDHAQGWNDCLDRLPGHLDAGAAPAQ